MAPNERPSFTRISAFRFVFCLLFRILPLTLPDFASRGMIPLKRMGDIIGNLPDIIRFCQTSSFFCQHFLTLSAQRSSFLPPLIPSAKAKKTDTGSLQKIPFVESARCHV